MTRVQADPHRESHARHRVWPAYLGIFGFALAIRLVWLGHQPLWRDELFSILWSRFDSPFLIGEGTRIETNPPAHFLVLKAWIAIAGDSAWSVRLPSAVASAGAVAVQYAIGRRLLNRSTALLGAVLLAVSPLSVAMAHEARPYGAVELAAAFVMLGATGFLTAAYRPSRSSGALVGWAAVFVASCVVAFVLHYTVLFLIAAALIATGLALVCRRPLPRSALAIWIGTGALTAAVIAVPLISAMSLSQSANIAWIQPTTPRALLHFVGNVFLGLAAFPYRGEGVVAVFALAALGIVRRYGVSSPVFWALIVLPGTAFGLLAIMSLHRPLLVPRYAEWLCIPGTMALAAGLSAIPFDRLRKAAIGVAILGLTTALAIQLLRQDNEHWPGLVGAIAHEPACRGPIVFTDDTNPLAIIYFAPALLDRPFYRVSESTASTAERYLLERYATVTTLSPSQFTTASQGPATVISRRGEDGAYTLTLGSADYDRPFGDLLRLSCRNRSATGGVQNRTP
ncbi:glycosyltransferase family 39 protein [Sphingomonas sp. 4RDLI-65]|uniref:glycosyltransferase family 39 protein n=1 Tax=Sphingomonas sp. 4RDLI-65 TaxID=3111641 RepID=UPI003C237BDE